MEDPRLSRMYAALLRREFVRLRMRIWQEALLRSGLLTIIGVILVVVALAVGWHEHRKGHFAKLKAEIRGIPSQPHESAGVRPGGQDVVVLQRSPLPGGGPEFLSATLLPGRGMSVLQITAYLPDKGEVELLASPSLDQAAKLLNATGTPRVGMTMGGAIEAPWAGRIPGSDSDDGETLTAMWRGRRLELPNDRKGAVGAMSVGGLLMTQASSEVKTNVMPDGGAAQATFHVGSFNDHWVSQTDITAMVQLSGRAIEMNVVARNVGKEAEPIGIGWHPRFAVVGKDRRNVILRLPNSVRVDIPNRSTGLPSGKLLPVQGTQYDFTKPDGTPLGTLGLDDCFVHLRPGLLDNGPAVEMRDPAGEYGLRITAVSSSIKAIRVYAPSNAGFVSINPTMNYDDPFGREWPKDEDTGMVILGPGQSVQWKIRVEIFPLQTLGDEKF